MGLCDVRTGKKQWPQKPGLPIVAITTTAGTGSETDGGAVITNPETNEKTGVFGPGTYPVLAIVDPELMTSVPRGFKAYQGFDALFHSTEGYISAARNEFSKMVAAEAIRNVARNLVTSIREPENMESMSAVALGSYLSGIQMAIGSCTSAHPLEHALSAYHEKLPHGAGLIMISKAYYSYFVEQHVCDDRFVEMAKLMGMEDASKPEDFITALVKLQEDYSTMLPIAVQQMENEDWPALQEKIENLADYDVIYLGTPVWNSSLPPALHTFFAENDLSSKTIVPFGIHLGSRFGRILNEMEELAPEATVTEGFTISADTPNDEVESEFRTWLIEK